LSTLIFSLIYSTDKGFDDIEEIERIFEILEKDSEYTEFLEWYDINL